MGGRDWLQLKLPTFFAPANPPCRSPQQPAANNVINVPSGWRLCRAQGAHSSLPSAPCDFAQWHTQLPARKLMRAFTGPKDWLASDPRHCQEW